MENPNSFLAYFQNIDLVSLFVPKYKLLHAYRFANGVIECIIGSNSHTNLGSVTLTLDQKHSKCVHDIANKMKGNNHTKHWVCYYLIFNSMCQMESWRNQI